MKFGDLIRLVLANLNRMRARVVMTALGVLIGTAAIVVLIALASGLRRNTVESFEQFGAINQITVFSGGFFGGGSESEDLTLTPEKLRELEDIPGVLAVTPRLTYYGSQVLRYNRLEGFASTFGIDPLTADVLGLKPTKGNNLLSRGTVVVGARVGESFQQAEQGGGFRGNRVLVGPGSQGAQAGTAEVIDLYNQTLLLEISRFDSVTNEEVTRTIRLRVAGVLEETGGENDYAVFMSLKDMEEIITWNNNGVRLDRRRRGYDEVIVVTEPDSQVVLEVEEEIERRGYFAFSIGSALEGINTVFLVIQAVLGGVGAIALLVAAIGIANTMIMSVLERTREIGLMKAVGATNRDVMSVFIAEAVAIGMLGGLLGVIFGAFASSVINILAVNFVNAQSAASGNTSPAVESIIFIPLWLPLFAIAFAMLIGLAAGIYPALRAVQLNPVTALKYE